MNNSPIFLLGSERSGTNLLRTRLDNHSNIAGPVPPHILKWLYNKEPYYGDLRKDKNFEVLVDDLINIIKIHLAPWEIKFNIENIKTNISPEDRSLMSLFEYVFDKYTSIKNKKRWFCKDNNLFNYAWEIKDYFPNAKFIYLVRDPRDVCLSNFKRDTGPSTAYNFALQWKEEQNKCINLYTEESFKDRIILIKYEDVLSSPEKIFKNICKFIGEDFESEMLQGKKRKEDNKTKQWKNISKNIMKNNKKKYKGKLTKKQIKIIEKITYKEMKFLNYKLDFINNSYNTTLFKEYYYKVIDYIKRKYNFKFKIKDREYKIRMKRKNLRRKINGRLLE